MLLIASVKSFILQRKATAMPVFNFADVADVLPVVVFDLQTLLVCLTVVRGLEEPETRLQEAG